MNRFITITLIGAALAACACTAEKVTGETVPVTAEPASPGRMLLKLDGEILDLVENAGAESNPLAAYGIESLERLFPYAGEWEPRTRKAGLHRYYIARLKEDVPATRAASVLSAADGVLSVKEEKQVFLRTFNDPYLTRYQWNMINKRYPNADIGVQHVWESLTVGSENVIVAVQDQGIDYTHPDLADNMWTDENGYHGYNFYNDTPNITCNLTGDTGHGTHVAGVISAVNNNATGLSSIAGGDMEAGIPGVRLMSCQIFSKGYSASSADCARAIKWGADHGAVISQNSWGDSADYNGDNYVEEAELEYYKTLKIEDYEGLKDAVDYFIDYAGCDNDGNQLPGSPMKGGLVIFAAGNEAIDYDPICAYDRVISVGAYGGSGLKASYSNYGSWVDLCAPGGDASFYIYSTVPGGKYRNEQGTSMACPHVSGVAALLVSYFGGPGFTADKCREYLMEGSIDNFITDTRKIGRKVDAYNSFVYAGVAESLNHAPEIRFASSVPPYLYSHETAILPLVVSDQDYDNVFVSIKDPVYGISVAEDDGSFSLVIEALKLEEEKTYDVTLVASDNRNASTELSLSFRVLANHAPECTGTMPDVAAGPDEPANVDLSRYFSDQDGEKLSYSAALSDIAGALEAKVENDILTLKPSGWCSATVTVTAADGRGKTASAVFHFVCRSNDEGIFVNPVRVTGSTYVYTDTETPVPVHVSVSGASGGTVLSLDGSASFYECLEADLSSFAPGIYSIKITYGGKSKSASIVKI